ncbi:hypothetical protein BDN72DRAFT_961540 [Pluteus cervinus]|uniref:Uncharacterized protein n=1 Tax=Pluteus cervinus TaxID=181527 RepID=A0ACD3ALG8_9AGAR|nr:hypothetical protein BDN72DRAFT_961540 [Pluteus cervinus]
MADPTSCPHLPPELEQEIFLLAFRNDYRDAINLVQIAKRVFDWLIPSVLHVVQFGAIQPAPITFNKSVYERYGHHVRHLFLESLEPDDVRTYLRLFPNVTNLAVWSDRSQSDIPDLLQLPLNLTCLSIRPPHKLFPPFSRLTHLHFQFNFPMYATENNTQVPYHELLEPVLYLPNLTHLGMVPTFSERTIELFLERKRCPELRVLMVIWRPSEGGSAKLDDLAPVLVADPRILNIKCDAKWDWEVGARGGKDMWEFADEVLASREH